MKQYESKVACESHRGWMTSRQGDPKLSLTWVAVTNVAAFVRVHWILHIAVNMPLCKRDELCLKMEGTTVGRWTNHGIVFSIALPSWALETETRTVWWTWLTHQMGSLILTLETQSSGLSYSALPAQQSDLPNCLVDAAWLWRRRASLSTLPSWSLSCRSSATVGLIL